MKKVTLISMAALACAASLLSFKAKQNTGSKPEFAVMKIIEPVGGGVFLSPGLFLSYGNGKTETAEFETLTFKKAPRNAETIQAYFVRLSREGYHLITATGGDYHTIYVFEKE